MKRREFIALLGGSATGAWPICLTQAQSRMLRVGAASPPRTSPTYAVTTGSFLKGMADLGYEEGRNFTFEQVPISTSGRPTQAEYNRIYRELAARNVDIFVAIGLEMAFKSAIAVAGRKPVVMIAINWDPLARGYISSLARPTRNVTGLIFRDVELTPKRVQLLTEIVPGLKAATVFWDRLVSDQWQKAQGAAAKLGMSIRGVEFSVRPYDYERAFEGVLPEYRGGLIVLGSPSFAYPTRKTLPDFTLRHRIPTMFALRPFVDQGGLASYGPNYPKLSARAAYFVDRIAKGANPADLPVELPKQFELVVNRKTAKALGITIPPSILVRADKLIE